MKTWLNDPSFGILLTLAIFVFYSYLFHGKKNPLLNPILFSMASIIAILALGNIPLDYYSQGADYISFLLGPVTVALALPFYRELDLLKLHMVPILVGVFLGIFAGFASIYLLGKLFHFTPILMVSLLPKSTTMAIAVGLSENFGGDPALTTIYVIIAGNVGFMFGPALLKILGIKHKTAYGLGLGSSSHAIGTNRAMEAGPTEGAMGSLAIGLAGLMTSFLFPFVLPLFIWN